MLGSHNRIHIVLALDAVIKAGQQAVGVGRQIHAYHVCLLICDVIQESGILMGKSVVILLPYIGSQDEVQGRDRLSPGKLIADLQPFRVLCRHGIHDTDKRLVARKETVTSGQKISFQPSLAHMLGEHGIHDTSVSGQAVVAVQKLSVPVAVLCLEYLVEAVGHTLIRSENTEVPVLFVKLKNVADVSAQFDHILCLGLARRYLDAVLPEIRQPQIL